MPRSSVVVGPLLDLLCGPASKRLYWNVKAYGRAIRHVDIDLVFISDLIDCYLATRSPELAEFVLLEPELEQPSIKVGDIADGNAHLIRNVSHLVLHLSLTPARGSRAYTFCFRLMAIQVNGSPMWLRFCTRVTRPNSYAWNAASAVGTRS